MKLEEIGKIKEARDSIRIAADKLAKKRGFATFDEWEEREHPRGEGGQFAPKGSGSASGESETAKLLQNALAERREKRKKGLARNYFIQPITNAEREESDWLMSKERKDMVQKYNRAEKSLYNELNSKMQAAKEQREVLKKEGGNGNNKKIVALTEKIRGYHGDLDDLALLVRERIKAGDDE